MRSSTEEDWVFEEMLQRVIASYPGETYEERVDAMAKDNPWMLEDLRADKDPDGLP